MKVFRWLLAAVLGATLPASSVLASDAKHVRGGEADAAVDPLEQGEGEEGRELTTACATPLPCGSPHLHFGTKADFIADRCENNWYDIVDPSYPDTLCVIGEPSVIVAAHLEPCKSQISSILYEVTKNGKTIRRFAELEWPYTVYGDAPADPLAVTTKTLGPAVYTITATIKGPNKCVYEVQNYQFTVVNC